MSCRKANTRLAIVGSIALFSQLAWAATVPERTELTSVKTPPTPSATPSGSSFTQTRHAVSRTGRFTVFVSDAPDVIPNQDNYRQLNIFVRDRQLGVTSQLPVSPTAVLNIDEPSISDDGRYVAFTGSGDLLGNGPAANIPKVFVADRQAPGLIEQISTGVQSAAPNAESFQPMISGDGRWVVFTSRASNLVPGDTNGTSDVFESDRSTFIIRRISRSLSGKQLNAYSQGGFVSSNGRFVVYETAATNASDIPGFTAGAVLFYDRDRNITELSSRNNNREPANLGASNASVSDDGRYIAFQSQATNLVPGTPSVWSQAFVRDRVIHKITCVSISSKGEIGNLNSLWPIISGNGATVAFQSQSTNLVPNDTNAFGSTDVFIHDLTSRATVRANVTTDGTEVPDQISEPSPLSISGDGHIVSFSSKAASLVPGDLNGAEDAFLHEVRPRTIIRIDTGGSTFTDSIGRTWQSDRGYNTGIASRTTSSISGTPDVGLYQTQRYDAPGGPELRYLFTVPNGNYLVRLHFAENYEPNFHAGKRVFDVDVAGTRRFTHLDIYAAAGGHAALIREASATVINGKLAIDFHHVVENPQVNAIEIIEQ